MVNRVLRLLHGEIHGLHEAAYLLGFFAFLSQLLALLRDRLFAATFGAGETLDIYYAAFRIPDLILIGATSMVSVSIVIPFLIEKIDQNRGEGKRFVDAVFTAFFGGILVVSVMFYLAAPKLLPILFPGLFDEGVSEAFITVTRVMLLQPILLGISNLFGAINQVHRRFFVYALSPIFYNIGIILGVIVFYPFLGIAGLAWGVVFGAFLHLLVQLPVIVRVGFLPRFTRAIDVSELWRVVSLSFPRTVALSASSLSVLFLLSLASFMSEGSIAVFNLSWNLQSVPLTIIGVSYSLAAFPTLVRLFSNGGREAFFAHLSTAARQILFWSFPALALFIVLRAQIVRVVLGAGAFSWVDTRLTAAALALFTFSVVAQGLVLLFVRGYYAMGKTRRPLTVNLIAAALVGVLGYLFSVLFEHTPVFRSFIEALFRVSGLPGTEVLVLPLAYSAATLVNVCILWLIFERDFPGFTRTVGRALFQSFNAAVIMGFVGYLALNMFDDVFNLATGVGIFLQGFFSGLLGVVSGIGVLFALGSVELKETVQTLHRKFWRAKIIGSD